MNSDTDSRGVQRGNCLLCGCTQYDRGTTGLKCIGCGHPPGKHVNMSTGQAGQASLTVNTPSLLDSIAPSDSATDMDMDSGCLYPGCNKPPSFDINTGLQDKLCSQHADTLDSDEVIGFSTLMSVSPLKIPIAKQTQPSRKLDFSLCPKSSGMKCPPTGHGPSLVPQMSAPTQLHNAAPLNQQCKLNGCTKRRWTEPNGYVHDFCGIRHAKEYEKQNSQVADELQCKTPGCYKKKCPNGQGGFFDYCGQYCRNNGGMPKTGMLASASAPNLVTFNKCLYPGCTQPKHCEPANGRVHDFCGRTHAYQARIQEINVKAVNIRVASKQEFSAISGKFQQTWAKGSHPRVSFIFIISNQQLSQKWTSYRNSLQTKHTEKYYHGTKLTCNITVSNALCTDQECGICGISNTGLDRRYIHKNINFQRFGHGFYLAPNSSKCHDYTQGAHNYRAMLQFDVCAGNKYNLKKGNEKLKGPPQGFDSVYGQTGGDLNYEELVLYNPDAALPKCIIVYQKDGVGKIAK